MKIYKTAKSQIEVLFYLKNLFVDVVAGCADRWGFLGYEIAGDHRQVERKKAWAAGEIRQAASAVWPCNQSGFEQQGGHCW